MAGTAKTVGKESPKGNAAQARPPFFDPRLDPETRIDALLASMTLDEKVEALSTDPSVPRLGVKGSRHVEGLHGLSQAGPANWTPPRKVPTTTFPQSYGLGETWDADLVRRVAAAEGFECRYLFQSPEYEQGGLVVRAPNADLGRDPRWGRTEECFGEDPFLCGSLTVAFVRGLQGEGSIWQTASLLKHFLANSNENGRESSSSKFDDRLWREYYSVPFRMGIVEGGARAFMAAYNGWNGVPCTVHPMLEEITRREWGMDGIVCTDGGAYRLLVTAHQAFPTYEEAAAAVLKAGVGQFLDDYREGVRTALAKGLLNEADLDHALRPTYRVMLRLGLLDPPENDPYRGIGTGPEPWNTAAHRGLAREACRKAIVLLKNDDLLPLSPVALRSIAVVGRWSQEVLIDWYSGGPPYSVSPLEGIRSAVSPDTEVLAALDGEEAVSAAARAEVAIVVVGNHPLGNAPWEMVERKSDGKEAVDRESIDLEDEALIKRILAVNPRTVVVLQSSFPYAINWTQAHAPAILHTVHNGQELGNALADVLFGHFNPAGRTTQTWPQSLDQLPPMMDYDIRNGRTYQYFDGEPLYPFGFGLSYTEFAYRRLTLSSSSIGKGQTVSAAVEVANLGARDGEEVVQLYVRHLDSSVDRPSRQLRGFARVPIAAGTAQVVEIPLRAEDLAYWDVASDRWRLEAGRVEVQVGPNSAERPLRAVLAVEGDLL